MNSVKKDISVTINSKSKLKLLEMHNAQTAWPINNIFSSKFLMFKNLAADQFEDYWSPGYWPVQGYKCLNLALSPLS